MAEITVHAATGRPKGSRASGRLRAAGKVPATVYGLGADPVAVAVEWRELRHALTTDAGLNVLIDLEIDGAAQALTVIKDLQRHPVRRDVLHVDFLRVSRDVEIVVEVPIVIEGEPIKVLQADGQIDHLLFNLTVSAKPADIPNEIVVDVSDLNVGDAVRVGDLALPTGVSTAVDPEEPVVVASASTTLELEAEVEGEEGEEGAEAGEGGEASAEGGAEGGAESSGGDSGEG